MSASADDRAADDRLAGAVVVAVVPGQSARVLREARHNARLRGVPVAVVHVDVTRFVTYEEPDGYVQTAPVDIAGVRGRNDLADVTDQASAVLDAPTTDASGTRRAAVRWDVRQLVGDPAIAIKQFAEEIDAALIVVGTRERGIGESIREFFTGSVAARLAHRQHRPILVVPLDRAGRDDEDLWPEL